jgi:hypothetical protein
MERVFFPGEDAPAQMENWCKEYAMYGFLSKQNATAQHVHATCLLLLLHCMDVQTQNRFARIIKERRHAPMSTISQTVGNSKLT